MAFESPPAPPVLPDAQPPPLSSGPSGRLHPLTLFFRVWGLLRGMLIPIVIFLVIGREQFMIFFLLVFMAGPLVASVLRYFSFTYRVEGGELILKHGLLGRTERNIPLARVQDVRLEQGVLHRLLNVVDVQVDTAGGEGPDAVLSVLAKSEAERLRATIFAQLTEAKGPQAQLAEDRTILRQVTVRELVLAGATSNKLASLLALVVLAERFGGEFIQEKDYQRVLVSWSEMAAQWMQSQSAALWVLVVAALAGLTILGMVFSIIGTVVMFYGFTLSRVGEDLHRSYGLLTRRSSSLPRNRIQLLKIEERFLRRWFRLATLRADTASGKVEQGQARGGRDVLLPVVPRDGVEPLLPVFFPDWDQDQGQWRKVSRRAIHRATFRGTVVCLGLTALAYWQQPDWTALWPLLFVPVVLWLSIMSYRHLGYGLGKYFFQTRRGWLSRASHLVPIRNAQVVVIEQTPFDRRHGVATLIVDTAGQAYTGGGPRISNVPATEAIDLGRHLARQAAATHFRV